MIEHTINENVEAVERERERERATLYLIWNLLIEIIEIKKRSNKNLLLKRIGYMCVEKEMIGYECSDKYYKEIAYHFIR